MAISGLVITLGTAPYPAPRAGAPRGTSAPAEVWLADPAPLSAISASLRELALPAGASLELGDAQGTRLPLVVETLSQRDDRTVFEAIRALPGVQLVEVAYVWFTEGELDQAPTRASHRWPTHAAVASVASSAATAAARAR